jgi:hypothetical protein
MATFKGKFNANQPDIIKDESQIIPNNNNQDNLVISSTIPLSVSQKTGIQGINQDEKSVKELPSGIQCFQVKSNISFTKVTFESKKREWKKDLSKDKFIEIVTLIQSDNDLYNAIAYMATQRLGGKSKDDKKENSKLIRRKLKNKEIYGKAECGYKGLLKYMPLVIMEIWDANTDKWHKQNKVSKYANGLETCFSLDDLSALGLGDHELLFCYIRLIVNLGALIKKDNRDDNENQLLVRYNNFQLGYQVSNDVKNDTVISKILNQLKNLNLDTSPSIKLETYGFE